jgi:hypothetical protein
MERLKAALETLDEDISRLEDKLDHEAAIRLLDGKKQADLLKASRGRETAVLAVAQKVAVRLDQTIDRVQHVLRD